MIRIGVNALESMGEVVLGVGRYYTLVQDECLVCKRDCYVIKPSAEETSCSDIVSVDVPKL